MTITLDKNNYNRLADSLVKRGGKKFVNPENASSTIELGTLHLCNLDEQYWLDIHLESK